MNIRLSTKAEAEMFFVFYELEDILGEIVSFSDWSYDDELYAASTDFFEVGGRTYLSQIIDAPENDLLDLMPIYLEVGYVYDFHVVNDGGETSIEIADPHGYALETVDGGYYADSSMANAVGTQYADSIVDFYPDYDGWYYVTVIANNEYVVSVGMVSAFAEEIIVNYPYIRSPDAYNWDNEIDTGDGWNYISSEGAQLYRAYMGAMGRIPDLDGFNWWFYEIESVRKSLFTMADGFINSPEFKGYADTNYNGHIDNHEFVTHMYEGVFGRSPDQGGYDYWMNELNSGASDQGEVLIYMTQSNEYIDQTLEVVADYLFT